LAVLCRSLASRTGSDGSSNTTATRDATNTSDSDAHRGRFASYASGASTPDDERSEDESVGSSGSGSGKNGGGLKKSDKKLVHSTSAIGLDEMIEERREGGELRQNVVHIEVRSVAALRAR
jgi:hypothetical protein